jgi:hypothetical protein
VPAFIAVVLAFILIIALLVPAGYGLPAPAIALGFLVLGIPGLFGIWLLYRRMTARGEVPPVGEADTARERKLRGEDTSEVVEPSPAQDVEFVGTGRPDDDEPSAPERSHG